VWLCHLTFTSSEAQITSRIRRRFHTARERNFREYLECSCSGDFRYLSLPWFCPKRYCRTTNCNRSGKDTRIWLTLAPRCSAYSARNPKREQTRRTPSAAKGLFVHHLGAFLASTLCAS